MARPALEALAEQQEKINSQDEQIDGLHKVNGQLARIAKSQQDQINRLTTGLQNLSQMAGVEHRVASAMGMRFEADVQNPAQPVASPPSVPSTQSTPEATAPEAMGNVQNPGMVPGTTNDVAADVTTTGYTPGQDVPSSPYRNPVDVTAPIEGTEGARPIAETKTLTDVRVGDPMNPQTAYPLQGGFQNAQRTDGQQMTQDQQRQASQQAQDEASNRTMASLRLARLRMQAGLETPEEGGDLALGEKINKDAALSTEAIEQEINTLDAVVAKGKQASQQKQARRNRGLVPQSTSGRQAPSMASNGSGGGDSDEDIFL